MAAESMISSGELEYISYNEGISVKYTLGYHIESNLITPEIVTWENPIVVIPRIE
jgi:hypothetical protein